MNPIKEALDAVIEGRPVDWPRIALLQELATVVEGRQYLDDAIAREKEADAQLEQFLSGLVAD